MHEKVLLNKKNGMAVMLLSVLFYAAAIVGFVFGCILVESGPSALSLVLLIVCAIWLLIGWIPFLGLKVLKPQEALVLTLFGKYVGTLKNDGFYYVNPVSYTHLDVYKRQHIWCLRILTARSSGCTGRT